MKTRYFNIENKKNKIKIKKAKKKIALVAVRGNFGSMVVTFKNYFKIKKIKNNYFFKGEKTTKKILRTITNSVNEVKKQTINLIGRNFKVIENEALKHTITIDAGYSNKAKYAFKGNENFLIEQKNTCSFFSLDAKKIKKITNQIRSLRPPNPYTGKGIFIDNEKIKRKQGKKTQY